MIVPLSHPPAALRRVEQTLYYGTRGKKKRDGPRMEEWSWIGPGWIPPRYPGFLQVPLIGSDPPHLIHPTIRSSSFLLLSSLSVFRSWRWSRLSEKCQPCGCPEVGGKITSSGMTHQKQMGRLLVTVPKFAMPCGSPGPRPSDQRYIICCPPRSHPPSISPSSKTPRLRLICTCKNSSRWSHIRTLDFLKGLFMFKSPVYQCLPPNRHIPFAPSVPSPFFILQTPNA
ncbi:hypothetical protein B0T21DRAFT_85004 [Apiosordaria backusii]|uniref:Uncharacterized protein n=1 Tax=Apiosordaria backusii TaxID=314023 RepID=A0AA40A0U4_9PEZI|nr:hypothetical protein B0T21DRAFT_85004 [Apiosordaria backusii]